MYLQTANVWDSLRSFLVGRTECLRGGAVVTADGLVRAPVAVTSCAEQVWSREANIATRGTVPAALQQHQHLTVLLLDQYDDLTTVDIQPSNAPRHLVISDHQVICLKTSHQYSTLPGVTWRRTFSPGHLLMVIQLYHACFHFILLWPVFFSSAVLILVLVLVYSTKNVDFKL